MWWIIGTLIGTALNIRQENKNPELKAKREKEAKQGCTCGCLVLLAFLILCIFIALMAGDSN
jgi:hypothetical protein